MFQFARYIDINASLIRSIAVNILTEIYTTTRGVKGMKGIKILLIGFKTRHNV